MRFGISAIASGVVVLTLTVVSQLWGAERGGQALIILDSLDFADMQKTIAALEKEGVRPVHVIPPRVVIGFVPDKAEVRTTGIGNVVSIYRSAAPAIGLKAGADLAMGVSAWNHLVSRRGAAPVKIPKGVAPLVGDAFEPPIPAASLSLTAPEVAASPGPSSTSEFMIGKVAVGVILPESNGGSENWDSARQTTVFNEIVTGLDWWATKGGSVANLTFYYDQKFSVPTKYEPITMNGTNDEYLWVSDIFKNMGYTSGGQFDRARAYINDLRTTFKTDWCYTFIVVDSLNDADGVFANGMYFAWAYLGGPYSVMTYDNDGWSISNMNLVASHETGHIFLAGDEYCQPGYACCSFGYYGYLNVYNGNCEYENPSSVPCMMRYNENTICQYTNGQLGWRDTDGDGKPDTIDNVVNNTLNLPTSTTQTILTFTGNAADVPCISPTRPSVTINRIAAVKYRVDLGPWMDASPVDGSFDEDTEDYTFTTQLSESEQHRIETQAYSTSGNVSSVAGWSHLTIYVDINATGASNGSSWTDAYTSLQSALSAAFNGDEIWVAAGTYAENITLKNGVALYGGFSGNETELSQRNWNANKTILDGNQQGSVITSPSQATTRVDGFTIRNGLADTGGGMYNGYNSSPTVTNCTFTDNWASYGGGMNNYGCSPMVTNCTFTGNWASAGGGIYNEYSSPTMTNCTFNQNSASSCGGGMHNCESSPIVTNCILWDNIASNGPQIYNDNYSYLTITYSDIEGGRAGTGNIDSDPLFVDTVNSNLRLQSCSPCVDTGSNAAVPSGVTTDLAGNPRIVDANCDGQTIVDMGAFEFYLVGDLSKNCLVDLSDIDLFTDNWLETGCAAINNWCDGADIDKDGEVTLFDFADIAGNWLESTAGV